MALAVSFAMAVVAVALLAIYGADVGVINASGGEGFLPLNSMERGIAFGLPPIVLSIAAYFVSRREPSAPLGCLILATGILVVVGGVAALVTAESQSGMGSEGGLLAVGAAIIALGVFKIVRSR